MTMTFKEFIDAGYHYPASVDLATQDLIYSYFKYRHLASNKKFEDWFTRTLNLRVPYYYEMLRVDPTVSKVDWFVEEYLERQIETSGKDSRTEASNNSSITENNLTDTNHNLRTDALMDSKQEFTPGVSSDVYTHGQNERSTESENKEQAYSRAGQLSRVSPMSASYTDANMHARKGESLNIQIGSMDKLSVSGYADGFPNVDITNPTQSGDALTTNGGVGGSQQKDIDKPDNHVETSYTGSDVTTASSLTQIEDNGSITHTGTATTGGSSSKDVSGESSGLNREIATGRHQLPASVLAGAKALLESTNAWDYLYKQLDKCFLQAYDYDEDDD